MMVKKPTWLYQNVDKPKGTEASPPPGMEKAPEQKLQEVQKKRTESAKRLGPARERATRLEQESTDRTKDKTEAEDLLTLLGNKKNPSEKIPPKDGSFLALNDPKRVLATEEGIYRQALSEEHQLMREQAPGNTTEEKAANQAEIDAEYLGVYTADMDLDPATFTAKDGEKLAKTLPSYRAALLNPDMKVGGNFEKIRVNIYKQLEDAKIAIQTELRGGTGAEIQNPEYYQRLAESYTKITGIPITGAEYYDQLHTTYDPVTGQPVQPIRRPSSEPEYSSGSPTFPSYPTTSGSPISSGASKYTAPSGTATEFPSAANNYGAKLEMPNVPWALGLTLEQVQKSKELGQWVNTVSREELADTGKNSCGKAVYELLRDFGIEGLPESDRHGKNWDNILDKRCGPGGDFVKVKVDSPADAGEGAILSYQGGFGSEKAKEFGHVEIKTTEGYTSFCRSPNPGGTGKGQGFCGYAYYYVGNAGVKK